MIDLIVAQVQRLKFVMGKQEFSNHHSAISFYLVQIQIQCLQIGTVLQGISKVLGTFAFYLVALQVKSNQAGGLPDQRG